MHSIHREADFLSFSRPHLDVLGMRCCVLVRESNADVLHAASRTSAGGQLLRLRSVQ
jgi:hypothetical protein